MRSAFTKSRFERLVWLYLYFCWMNFSFCILYASSRNVVVLCSIAIWSLNLDNCGCLYYNIFYISRRQKKNTPKCQFYISNPKFQYPRQRHSWKKHFKIQIMHSKMSNYKILYSHVQFCICTTADQTQPFHWLGEIHKVVERPIGIS